MSTSRKPVCSNLNHRRPRPRVRHCPACGDLVNVELEPGRCSPESHAQRRRRRWTFCADCGAPLADREPGRG